MRSAVDHWWVRILVMIAAVGGIGVAGASMAPEIDPVAVQSVVYGAAILVMVGIEKARPGGSPIASGIVPTAMTPRLAMAGGLAAILGLGAVGIVSVLGGGRFEVVNDERTVNVISTMVLFAIGEEVLFRGTIFSALEERFGPIVAVLFTSLPFALVHTFNPGTSVISIINVGLAGIALGTAVAVTSSLWTSIGFHVLWNLGTALIFGPVSGIDMAIGIVELRTDGMSAWTQALVAGPFGIEDGVMTTVVLLIACILVLRWRRFDPFVRAARYQRSFPHPR
jgi:membrane protease YdiL (CAAX protease family)